MLKPNTAMREFLPWHKQANQPSASTRGETFVAKYNFEVTASSGGLDEHYIYSFLFTSATR